MQTLNIIEDNFDQDNTFAIELQSRRGTKRAKCSVRKDYQVKGDGILWALQHGATLKSHYSANDVAERNRLNNNEPVRHGDIVIIDGKQYTVRVLGDYSNCALFDPVEQSQTGTWIKGTEDDDEDYEYIPSAAELS